MVGSFEGVDDLLVVEDNPGDVRFIEVAVQESELGPHHPHREYCSGSC